MKTERERPYKATVFLTPALHKRAERLAAGADMSVSKVLARALARYLKERPVATEDSLPARRDGEIKTSVFLSATLRARAKRAAAEGGSLQEFFIRGLEMELHAEKVA